MEPFFSIVCIFNKPDLLKKDLLDSLERQTFREFEVVTLDTKAEGFDRASASLNAACARAKGRYLVVAHQDMIFTQPDTLERLAAECEPAFEQDGYGLLGSAGAYAGGGGFNGMEETDGPVPGIVPCMTVDECILVLPRRLKEQFQFSDLGKTWHAYGADICMQLGQAGYKIGVFRAPVWHDWGTPETGSQTTDLNYFMTMGKLTWKYRGVVPAIATTGGLWPTGWGYSSVLRRRLPMALRGWVKKHAPKKAWAALKKAKDTVKGKK